MDRAGRSTTSRDNTKNRPQQDPGLSRGNGASTEKPARPARSLQELVLTTLAFDEAHGAKIAEQVRAEHFEGVYSAIADALLRTGRTTSVHPEQPISTTSSPTRGWSRNAKRWITPCKGCWLRSRLV